MKTYLNLGCGSRFNSNWTNVDIISQNESVLAHNLREGIPFKNESFDFAYHSHVLEHFSKVEGEKFIEECHRVLKKGGILRIVVPDLEKITILYLECLKQAVEGQEAAKYNYEWMLLEMYDQTVRNKSGGEMASYLYQDIIPNEAFIYERIGEEGKNIRKHYLESRNILPEKSVNVKVRNKPDSPHKIPFIQRLKEKAFYTFFKKEADELQELKRQLINQKEAISIGQFRLEGQVHQWMYDRYSLKSLLQKVGFKDIKVQTAFSSNIPNWNSFELDGKDDIVFKPDSIFIEGIKI